MIVISRIRVWASECVRQFVRSELRTSSTARIVQAAKTGRAGLCKLRELTARIDREEEERRQVADEYIRLILPEVKDG